MTALPDGVHDSFTYLCTNCRRTVTVIRSETLPHECNDTERDEQWALQKKAYQSTEIANELRARAAREDERAAEYRKQLGQDAGSEVEELAATLNDSLTPFYEPFDWHEATSIAATILAGGYRKLVLDESAINRAAQALHDLGATAMKWDERDDDLKDLYREDARAVIAALPFGSAECPPRMDGDKPHCPDCSGIVGETGVVW